MKVKDLIAQLQNMNPDAIVVVAKDAEGNNFSPLSEAGEATYIPRTTWYGEVPHPDDLNAGYYDEDSQEDAVVLWPTN